MLIDPRQDSRAIQAGRAIALLLSLYFALNLIVTFAVKGHWGIDFATFTRNASLPLVEAYAPRATSPFAYPPTMHLFFRAIAGGPDWFAYLTFTAVSLVFLIALVAKHMPGWALVLMLVSYPVVNAALCGQLSILVAALTLAGFVLPNRYLGGLAFAVAAGLKPQLVAFVPVCLLAVRDWKAIMSAGLGYCSIVAATLAVYGIDGWTAWADSLGSYRSSVVFRDLVNWIISPSGIAEREGFSLMIATAFGALIGLALSYRRHAGPIEATAAVTLSALLISPYALPYDLLGCVPFLAMAVAQGRLLALLPYLVTPTILTVPLAALALLRPAFWRGVSPSR